MVVNTNIYSPGLTAPNTEKQGHIFEAQQRAARVTWSSSKRVGKQWGDPEASPLQRAVELLGIRKIELVCRTWRPLTLSFLA